MNISDRGKEPWFAVNLSMFFPGIGQIYSGNVWRGIGLIIFYILLIGIGGWLIFIPTGDTEIGFIILLSTIVVSIWNLFDAHRCARKANKLSFEALRKSSKDPWFAVFLSRIIPGLGHIYIGKIFIGAFLCTIYLLSIIASAQLSISIIIGIINFLISPFVVYHAYIAAPARRERSRSLIIKISALLIIVPLVSTIPAFLIRNFVAEARYIPSGAMLPTLQINDRLIIDKLNYRFQEPQRGDIVVFMAPERAALCFSSFSIPDQKDSWSNSPTDTTKPSNPKLRDAFIKRIIGLPGDKVEIKGEQVYINNKTLQEKYISAAPSYQFGPVTVPAKSYLVLGDNRNNSCDSHFWGPVPRDNIIGKATKRFWPLDRMGKV